MSKPRFEVLANESDPWLSYSVIDTEDDEECGAPKTMFVGSQSSCEAWIDGRMSLDLTLTVRIEKPYGHETIYPVCDLAKKFAALLGQKTLTRNDINQIKGLGYVIETKPTEGEKL